MGRSSRSEQTPPLDPWPLSLVAQRDSVNPRDGQLVARRGCVACDAWLVFEGFTERARQVVVYAQEEVRGFGHDHIGTEHILLGLLRQEEGLAARVLEYFGLTVERVREQVVRIVGPGEAALPPSGQIPFTPRAKRVLEMAPREALSLGQTVINTEHILLGLVRENDGVASRILLDLDVEPERIRNEAIRMSGGHRGQPG